MNFGLKENNGFSDIPKHSSMSMPCSPMNNQLKIKFQNSV